MVHVTLCVYSYNNYILSLSGQKLDDGKVWERRYLSKVRYSCVLRLHPLTKMVVLKNLGIFPSLTIFSWQTIQIALE